MVLDIIRQHSKKEKETIEARMMSDADYIDHVGAMDVWRMFHYSAFQKRTRHIRLGGLIKTKSGCGITSRKLVSRFQERR